MDWLTENWLWLVLGSGFVWMHLRMHGGHRAHGGCGGGHGSDGADHESTDGAEQRVDVRQGR